MDSILQSGVVTRTGGIDHQGRVLLTFLTSAGATLASSFAISQLVSVSKHYIQMAPAVSDVAFLVDAGSWKEDAVRLMMEMIRQLADEFHIVSYVLRPSSKRARRYLNKQLTNNKKRSIQLILLRDASDLTTHIDLSQLTSEFDGTLAYNHALWCSFAKEQTALEIALRMAADGIGPADDRLRMMLEYDVPHDTPSQDALLQQIRSKYNALMRDLNLEHNIDACKIALRKLDDPAYYADICSTPAIANAKTTLLHYEQILVPGREQLKSLWQRAEERIFVLGKMDKYREKTTKVLDWLGEVGIPSASTDAHIGSTLSEAELCRTQFVSRFYATGQNVIWLSGKLQKKMELLTLSGGVTDDDVLGYIQKFVASVQYFRQLLEAKMIVYTNVSSFHQTCYKISKWISRTLQFLPADLFHPSVSQPAVLGPALGWWPAVAADFCTKHPAPTEHHLSRLRQSLALFRQVDIRNSARLLVYRAEVLRKVLQQPSVVKSHELQSIFYWRQAAIADCQPSQNSSSTEPISVIKPPEIASPIASRTPKLRAQRKTAIDQRSATLPPSGRFGTRHGMWPSGWRSLSRIADSDGKMTSHYGGDKMGLHSRAHSCRELHTCENGNERYISLDCLPVQLVPPSCGRDSDSGIARTVDSSHTPFQQNTRTPTNYAINIDNWMERQEEDELCHSNSIRFYHQDDSTWNDDDDHRLDMSALSIRHV